MKPIKPFEITYQEFTLLEEGKSCQVESLSPKKFYQIIDRSDKSSTEKMLNLAGRKYPDQKIFLAKCKRGVHRFVRPNYLALLEKTLEEVTAEKLLGE